MSFFDKILRMGEGRVLKKLKNISHQVNAIEDDIATLSDDELKGQTEVFKERLAAGETLDDLLIEAFAVVREASKRTLGQRHFDVQIMGGAALHMGNIAEMKTGEGKTLVATLPAYLNALSGDGVHVVTVNDYLASYQSNLMGRVFRMLGMTTGCIVSGQTPAQRREEYAADITYGTNNEFGFDFLRDNMAWKSEDLVQRGHNYAIVDEVDSILIDEARTPLIISGPAHGDSQKWYVEFAALARQLKRDVDYEVDEKKRTVGLLEPGIDKVEDRLGIDNLYESLNTPLIGFINNAVKAKELFKRDKDYVVINNEVLIVDEHTGRMLAGRRYSEGMHQAVEAKENVPIKAENQTLATITLQNYFRLYNKLGGMTGTAETEAAEFNSTYNLGVVPIPTNRPMQRIDQPDQVYLNQKGKFTAVIADIVERHAKGQPILVGTTSVERSEELSQALRQARIPHEVLNAKHHEREASIVAMAGRKGAVTVATNMAGRGTDIMLGGNAEFVAVQQMADRGYDTNEDPEAYEAAWPEVLAEAEKAVEAEREEVRQLGGLYVLGTERHESRRIDNQLRGRSGRQGDPGESRFYLALSDDLMRRFNPQMVESIMQRSGVPEDVPIESKMISRGIANAQAQVEAQNQETRKNILKYDDVLSRQREVVYGERKRVLNGEDLSEQVQSFIDQVITTHVRTGLAGESPSSWDLEHMFTELKSVYPVSITAEDLVEEVGGDQGLLTEEFVLEQVQADARIAYNEREEKLGPEVMRYLERRILLAVLDRKWREHLYEMDYLKEGIGLRAMAQRDPLIEYQREGYHLFQAMIEGMKEEVVSYLYHYEVKLPEADGDSQDSATEESQAQVSAASAAATAAGATALMSRLTSRNTASQNPARGPRNVRGGAAIQSTDDDQVEYTFGSSGNEADNVAGQGSSDDRVAKMLGQEIGGPQGEQPLQYSSSSSQTVGGSGSNPQQAVAATADGKTYPGTGRNEQCPCGSGKKYKVCHGRNE